MSDTEIELREYVNTLEFSLARVMVAASEDSGKSVRRLIDAMRHEFAPSVMGELVPLDELISDAKELS